jgi:hypothetical protein
MRTHDHDIGSEEVAAATARRVENDSAIAALAVKAGKPGALDAGAVMHLQRAAGNANVASFLDEREQAEPAAAEPSPVKDVVGSGGGAPLDAETRGFMESRLGHDFGGVRIHTDDRASESAKAVNAHAYTVGNNVVFQRGRYEPETDAGKRMLAHELTHVIQQQSGPVDGTPTAGGIRVSDPSDRFEREAERSADNVMSAQPSDPAPPAPTAAMAPPVQRQEEEEDLQGSFVQRQEEEKEEEEVQGFFVQRAQEDEEIEETTE